MDSPKHVNRIPAETIGEKGDTVSSWNLPDMHLGSKVFKSAKRDKSPHGNESIENVKAQKAKPLTAEELMNLAKQAEQEGYKDGFEKGLKKGVEDGIVKGERVGHQKAYAEAKKEIQSLQNTLRSITESLFDPTDEQNSTLENYIVDMAVDIASRIIGEEIEKSPEHLIRLVSKAMHALPKGAKNIRVYLNAQDIDLLRNLQPETAQEWNLHVDPELKSGGCRIETQESLIDFCTEKRIQYYLDQMQYENTTAGAIENEAHLEEPQAAAITEESVSTAPPARNLQSRPVKDAPKPDPAE